MTRTCAKKAEIQRTKDRIMANEEFAVKRKGFGLDFFGGFTLKPTPRFQGEDFSGINFQQLSSKKNTFKIALKRGIH